MFNIGNVKFNSPFILAPLAGITDSPFRRICKEFGAALVYSEMISAKGLYYNDKSTERLLKFYSEEKPIAFQIFGSDAGVMAWAAEKLSGRENCILDINMGCPVPKVAKNGEGSALMKNPELAENIVKSMVEAEERAASEAGRSRKPITVKCRTGWDRENINILDFALKMEEAGASAIAVHARTREQYYSGKADWDIILKVKERVGIPVIGSGDVFTGADAVRMLKETGCDFVMFARGALGNPWVFRDALALFEGLPLPPPPSIEEKLDIIMKHISLLLAEKGEAAAVREMRKHVGWYLKGIPRAAEVRRKVNSLTTVHELRNTLENI